MQPIAVAASADGFAPVTRPHLAGRARVSPTAPTCDQLRRYINGWEVDARARIVAAELLDWREGRLPRRDVVSDDASYREAVERLAGGAS